MKISELNNYLTAYVADEDIKSLLIDGKWGIGKTYTITQFLKSISANKEIKAHYCSLFGCPDINTLHQQLYAKFHPHKIRGLKALSYVPLAVNLTTTLGFETGIDTSKIAEDIESNRIYKSINIKEKTCLVIFDDLERTINYSTINMEELLGYFNRLRSENIKIIVLCNEEEIHDEIFNKFKEKVFDRSINIEQCDDSVIEKFFGDNYKYLKNNSLELIEDNLRTAYKISIFLNEANKFLKENKVKIDTEDLIFVCTNIVSEFFTQTLSQKYKADLDERAKSEDNFTAFYTRLELEKQGSDEFRVEAISRNLANHSVFVDNTILNSLYRLFVYLDKSSVNKVKTKENIFYENKIFYLSDENKVKYIDNKIKVLDNSNIHIPDNEIIGEIESWLKYCTWYFTDDILNNLVTRILQLSETKVNKNIANAFINHEHILDKKDVLLRKFFELLKAKTKQKLEIWCINYFKTIIDNLNNYSGQLSQLLHFLNQNNLDIPNELVDIIVKNNFFIPDLSGDININLWDFCHSICYFVVNKMPKHKEVLSNYLLSLKNYNKNSKCLSERIQSLIDNAIYPV